MAAWSEICAIVMIAGAPEVACRSQSVPCRRPGPPWRCLTWEQRLPKAYSTGSARRLATPDEIIQMPPNLLLLLRQGERPLVVDKIRYFADREFAGMHDPA